MSAVVAVTGRLAVGEVFRDLNKQRRIRRMRRVVIASAEGSRDFLGRGSGRYDVVLVTLTYRPTETWRAEQIALYIQAVKDWARRLPGKVRLRYQWVIELTQRGVPHYHILWWLPHGLRLPKPDASGAWPYGLSRIERARNAVGYLVKYATKGETGVYTLPKGCRLFGVGGGLEAEKLATHRAGLPMWLYERLESDSRGRRVARVGWIDCGTGEIHQSPFEVCWWRDDWGIVVFQILRTEEVIKC